MTERSKEKVEVIVPVEAAAGKADVLRPILMSMVAPSRAEAGCEFYNLLESHVPGHFIFHELWTTQAALDAHDLTPHYLAFKEKTKGLYAQPPVVHKVHLCTV